MRGHSADTPRRRSARIVLWAVLGLAACSPAEDAPAARPNLLLVSLDTLRADYLGCYGYARNTSPNIDAVAARGTLFADVTAASPWTLPSHATMLTGLYPRNHGVTSTRFRLATPSLPAWLGAAGYQTMAIANALLVASPKFGLLEGFERKIYEPAIPRITLPGGGQRRTGPTRNSARKITALAVQWLKERDGGRPFFLFLHFFDAHTDLTPEDEWRREFVGPYDGALTGATQELVRSRGKGAEIDEADASWLREMYAAEIRTLDEALQDLFDYMDRQGLSQNTVLMITSDHGEEFLEHGGVLHGLTYYQEMVHVPLILRGPGVPVGRTIAEPAHLVDVAPTLLALAGVPHGEVDGVDLTQYWRAPEGLPEHRVLFSEADQDERRRMVRSETFKLHLDTTTGERQLYDLRSDPGEQRDVLEERPEVAQLLLERLEGSREVELEGREAAALSDDELGMLRSLGYVVDGAEASSPSN